MSTESQTSVYCCRDVSAVDSARHRARLRSRNGHALRSTWKIFLHARSHIRVVRRDWRAACHWRETVSTAVSVPLRRVDCVVIGKPPLTATFGAASTGRSGDMRTPSLSCRLCAVHLSKLVSHIQTTAVWCLLSFVEQSWLVFLLAVVVKC